MSAPYSSGIPYPTVSGMLTVVAPAATTARETSIRYSTGVRPPSSAENSTSATYLRASATAAAASSSTCARVFFNLYLR